MINRVVLVGRLTRDPELKYTTNGIANLRFSIAVNRTFTSLRMDQCVIQQMLCAIAYSS